MKLPTKKPRKGSPSDLVVRTRAPRPPQYPLQGSDLDVPVEEVLALSPAERDAYIGRLLDSFCGAVSAGEFALKSRTPFAVEMKDLRKLLRLPADQFLFVDDRFGRRNVLGKGSPGHTHAYWSRTRMWRMRTAGGDLAQKIDTKAPSIVKSLRALFDPEQKSKDHFRPAGVSAVRTALSFLEFNHLSGTAFPPFHAKFFADRYLPKRRDAIVFDPCAGWGGRLIGTLLVNRKHAVHYYATDPETRNEEAYEGLKRRAKVWLKSEIPGPRDATIFYEPFEDWIASPDADKLKGKVDLVITSPPYFDAENYNPENINQSANRYNDYKKWRDEFYRQLMRGASELLRPNGHFVLNIADVATAPRLERDARILAREFGFVGAGFFKLAMSALPAVRQRSEAIKSAKARKRQPHLLTVRGKTFKYEPVFVFRKT